LVVVFFAKVVKVAELLFVDEPPKNIVKLRDGAMADKVWRLDLVEIVWVVT
jgi:hypothetical protein